MSKYYYHGIHDSFEAIPIVLEILITGGIKCKRLLGKKYYFGYNEGEYVSVCKKYSEKEYEENRLHNAFYTYIQNCFCFIISDSITAIKTKMDYSSSWLGQPNQTIIQREGSRLSDMFDEWQVKEQISLSSIVGIGIPLKRLDSFMDKKEEFELLQKIIFLALSLGIDIVDSSDPKFVEKYEEEKLEEPKKVY